MGVLNGLTILDFTQGYAGAFCTMQLADFGARVIKIELPETGDYARRISPIKNGASGYFASVSRNKESVALDFTKEENAAIILSLVKNADVVVDGFSMNALKEIGLGYEEMKKANKGLIYAAITNFGVNDAYSNSGESDNVIQAMSGIQMMTGFPDKEPSKIGPPVGESISGLNLTLGILLAHYHRMNMGEGQLVDVSMLDSVFAIQEGTILQNSMFGIQTERCGNNDAGILVPYDVYECGDGYFSAGLASDAGWDRFCKVIEMSELEHDPRFETNELRCKNYEIITPIIEKFFLKKTRNELQEIFSKANIPNAPVLSVEEVFNHPQLKEREMLVEIEDIHVGKYIGIGNPMKMDKTPPEIRKGSPELGKDTQIVLKEFLNREPQK